MTDYWAVLNHSEAHGDPSSTTAVFPNIFESGVMPHRSGFSAIPVLNLQNDATTRHHFISQLPGPSYTLTSVFLGSAGETILPSFVTLTPRNVNEYVLTEIP